MKEVDIKVGTNDFHVRIASTEEERVIGLSKETALPKNEGMLFVYDELQEEGAWYTMDETSIDLDIVFFNEDQEVILVKHCKAFSERPIVCEEPVLCVLEVAINSGIKIGDILEGYDDDLSEEEADIAKRNKMLILDENGNVQYRLVGGERIISRRETKQLIRLALKAYKSDSDIDYKAVGRKIFKILDGQDSRSPEFIEKS